MYNNVDATTQDYVSVLGPFECLPDRK